MGEIEVNEYVRTKNGKIDKVINSNFYMSIYVESEKGLYLIENIVKHSKQLIDLIEVGDYVNGEKIVEIDACKDWIDIGSEVLFERDIQTILTKEQYIANCYKVGGEDETSND